MSKLFVNKKMRVIAFALTLITISGIGSVYTVNKNKKEEETTTTTEPYTYNNTAERISAEFALHIIENIDNYKMEKLKENYYITEIDREGNEIRSFGFNFKYIDIASRVLGYDVSEIFDKKVAETQKGK